MTQTNHRAREPIDVLWRHGVRYVLFRSSVRIATLFTSAAVCLILACCMSVAQAIPPDHIDEALRKMCERGLATSAARYCESQAALSIEQDPQRARWTLRQLECLCQAALASSSGGPGTWEQITAIEADYRREFSSDARLPWLAWQLARADLLRAQQALAKWLATPASQQLREAALQSVRHALSQLDEVEADIKQRLPLSDPRNPASRTQAPSSELNALAIDCTLLRCEALLVRARCYPKDSPDRLAASADVDRIAGQMLLRAPHDWPARDELLVARATAGLEVGKRAESKQILEGILNEQPVEATPSEFEGKPPGLPSPRARIRAGAALIEALCEDRELAAAVQALQTLSKNFEGPEVQLAQLQLRLAQLDTQQADARSAQLNEIIDQTKRLGERYGGYWRSRGEALLLESVGEPANANEHQRLSNDLVSVEVRQLLAGGQTSVAIARLRAASGKAQAEEQPTEALEFALQAAALLQREKEWLTAADVLMPVTLQARDASTAPAAHALAAWCLGQALRADPGNAQLQQRYEMALKEQLAEWPDAGESLKAEEFLSTWLTSNKRFDELANMWCLRAQQTSQPELKTRALRRWLETLLSQLPLSQAPAQQDKLLQAIREGRLANCERSAAVIAITAAMLTAPLTQTEAEALTGLKVPTHAAEETDAEQALLSAVLALAAARRDDATACRNALQNLYVDQMSVPVNLAWTKSMVEAFDEHSAGPTSAWIEAANLIPLPDESVVKAVPALKAITLRLQMWQSTTASQTKSILQELKKLADQHPRDAYVQLAYAAGIAHSDRQRFDEAVRLIKRVAIGSSRESDTYLRARWLEIRWRQARGESKAASEIAALTLAGQTISTAWWKARFSAAASSR